MDDTDRKLIALLRDNARLPVATLAALLKVSRGTVQNRLDRLQASGVIQGFTLRLMPEAEAEAGRIRAITLIEVAGERTEAVLRSLRGMAEVSAVHSTNGRWDLVVELTTGTLEGFDAALQRIRQIRGVAATETSLLLTTHKV